MRNEASRSRQEKPRADTRGFVLRRQSSEKPQYVPPVGQTFEGPLKVPFIEYSPPVPVLFDAVGESMNQDQ